MRLHAPRPLLPEFDASDRHDVHIPHPAFHRPVIELV
jgi:hypothetical protein